MKNLSIIFANVATGMKTSATGRKRWRTEYHSLSRLLRDAQTKAGRVITDPIFQDQGIKPTGKIKQADILALLSPEQFKEDKKTGEKLPCIVSRKLVTEDAKVGQLTVKVPKLDKDGNKQYTYHLSPIKEGQWTLDKLVQLLETANEFKK